MSKNIFLAQVGIAIIYWLSLANPQNRASNSAHSESDPIITLNGKKSLHKILDRAPNKQKDQPQSKVGLFVCNLWNSDRSIERVFCF